MSIVTCPSCHTPVPPGAIYCDNCGFDLRTAAPPVAPTFKAAEPGGGLLCPTCGHNNLEGSAFCENCGTKLGGDSPAGKPAAAPPYQPPIPPPPAPVSPPFPKPVAVEPVPFQPAELLFGRLEIVSANAFIAIPSGKQTITIGREDPVSGIFPEIDLDPYGGQEAGVGRRHAQLLAKGGQVYIEDLESVNGTVVNRQKIAPRQPHPVQDGDELRLGRMVIIYHAH